MLSCNHLIFWKNIKINPDGSFSMDIAYEYTDGIPYYTPHTKVTSLKGSPLDINEGLASAWYAALGGAEDDARMAAEQKAKMMGIFTTIGSLALSFVPLVPDLLASMKFSKQTVGFIRDSLKFKSTLSSVNGKTNSIYSIADTVNGLVSPQNNPFNGKNFTRTEAQAYISQLHILGATTYAADIEGSSVISYAQIDGTTAYFNWLAYRESEKNECSFEEFITTCQNPTVSKYTNSILVWYETVGNSNSYPESVKTKYPTILEKEDFKKAYSNYTWPADINQCSKEQLDIIYDYYEKH